MPTRKARKKSFVILFIALIVSWAAFGLYWHFIGSKTISTDNAYVAADNAQVTAAIDGIINNIAVINTQAVKQGDLLVQLDPTDTRLALQKAQAQQQSAKASYAKAVADLTRRRKLAENGAISSEDLAHATSSFLSAKADLALADAAVEQATVNLSRTTIVAPISGVVAKRQVEVGQRIAIGSPLLTIVPLANVYVEANFKEVQLAHVHPGQAVTLTADLYGDDIVFNGVVEGLSGGTGSAFAIIPAQNATGNWIKVVQRLPVRIRLDPQQLARYPLQVGLSMTATIRLQ